METQAVDYLVKEFSEILGKIETTPMQDLLMLDAVNRAKKIEQEGKQDLLKVLEALEELVYQLTGEQECEEEIEKAFGTTTAMRIQIAQRAIKKAKGE